MIADRHYATDVLLGASLGTTAGFLLPWLFHYRGGLLDTSRGPGLVVPRPASSFPIGPFWSGAF
jgi:membrane-associated phospholipid phosphatase